DFNAFGEVIARRVDDRLVEYSEYDAAGRVWRTNAGDGIDKVMLYDQQGRVTATIRSAGAGFADLDLRNAGTVDQIAQLADIRRTDTVYDALGRAVRQVFAQRTDAVGGVTVRQVYSHGAINSSAQRASNESGNTGWIGSNSITASWTSLASLGGGDILVELIYQAAGSVAVDESLNFTHIPGPVLTRSQIFSGTDAAAANTGVAMSWQDEGVEGGIEKIAALTVYKKDVHGDWRQVIGPSRGMLTNTIEIAAPNNPKTQVQVQIAAAETGNWATVAAIDFGGVLRADLSALEHGTYQYRVLTTEPGSTAAKTSATGTIGITQQPLVPISNILNYDPFGAGMLSWQTPGASVDQVFRYRPTGTSNWADLEVGSRIDGYSGVNTSALGAGAYDYELVWLHGDDGKAYAHATGQLNISAPLPARYVPPVNLPAIDGLALVHGVVGGVGTAVDESGQIVPGGVFMGWNESGQTVTGGTPDYAIIWPMQRFTQTSVFQYRPAGATAWSERSVDSIITGFDEMSQAQGTHFVVVGDLPPGAYEYKLLVTLNGQSSPTFQATGNLNINGAGPGHYDTVNLQVQVPVTVMPPDPANFIIGVTPTWYGAPVFIGVDESNAPILGAHYEWNGNVVVGVPYTETRVTGTTMQPVTVYVPVETQVVIGYDESQNPVYETQITHEARTVLQDVPVYGTFTVYPPDPARYVTVPGKPIYGPPVAFNFNFNEGPTLGEHYAWQGDVVVSVPYTVMQTETRQQQIWVAGTAPPPTMVLTTPPYTPGYTIPATPKRYALVSTTASNPGGLSTGGSATLAPAGVNDQSASYRPLVNRTYDRWGNVLTVTDPRSPDWITTYKYNLNNQLTEQVQPGAAGAQGAGPVTRIRYDRLGREVAVTDANGHVNSKVYDAAGNLTAEIHADGGIVRHAFDAFGNEVQTSDAMGNVTAYSFDKLDRVTATTRGIAEIYTVNANNSLAFVNARAIGERIKYDEAGRVLWSQNGNNETTRYGYDLRGNITSTTLPAGQVTYHAFDPQGRRTAEVDANGSLATWEHDYFGRLTGHRDIGGATYSYTYDNAGQLIAQTNSRGQSLAYQYDAAGQQTQATDHALGQATTYAYNLAGQRVLEKTVQDGITYQESHLSYDALGRLRRVSDGRVDLTYDYDNVGNRLHIGSHVITAGNAVRDKHLYYAYDQMNRQIVVDAVDAAGTIVQGQGHRLGYDLNGNRTSDTSIGNRITAGGGDSHVAGYTVDGSGQLLVDESGKPILNVSVDALGRVYYGGDIDGNLNYLSPVTATTPATYSASIGSTTEQYRYDALGRISRIYRDGTLVDTRRYDGASRMVQSGPGGTLSPEYTALLGGASANGVQTTTNRFDANGRLQSQRVFNARGEDKSDTIFDIYDAVGNLLSYSLTNYEGDQYTNTYASTLTLYEGYKEAAVTATSTRMQPGSVANTYDVNGNLIRVTDSTQSANSRTLVNDAAGHVLYRNQAGNQQYFVFANGQQIGSTGMGLDTQAGGNGGPGFVEVQDFNIGYRPIDSQYPSAGVGSYRVMAGDTLQSIAQGAYGDSNLWYTLAEVNGLRGNSDLRVGQSITIPNKVAGVHNDGNTFTPYDPARSVGDTTPNMAAPGKDGGCGALGTIIMVVVAAVVMIYAPAAAPELFNVIGQAGGALAQGAVAGAAGAVVSQAVGIAIGAQDGFSWKQVALAAISNGVTHGLGAADFIPDFGGTSANVAARAAVNNALTQGIGVATGLQRSFSWTGVAAAAVGAGVGDQVSSGLKGSAFEEALGGSSSMAMRTLRGFAAGAATAVSGGGRVNMAQIAADAFGNALGNSLADSIRTVSQQDNELNRAQDLVHFGQELTAGDPHNIAGVRWFLENSVAGPGVGIAQLGRDRLSLSDGEASGIDDKVNVATEDEIAARIAKQDAHRLQQLKDELADLQKRRAELERERAYPANSDSPEVSSGLELNSGLLSSLPLGAGFLRGLSGYQRSVFDAPASVSENIGLALNGAFTEGINLIKEPFAEIVDLTRVGFQVARMGSGFHAQSVEPYSMAGKAGASGMAYGDFAGGMLDGIASAPGHLLVNGLNGNWREFGSNLV
ncbi:MAG: repeat protein, partial [Herminiimonas sp.]|nr:repeat protein [Herminiimonas sp.]